MNSTKSMRNLSFGFLILIVIYAIYSLLDIITIWTNYPVTEKFYDSNFKNYYMVFDTKHRIITTIYLSLNITLLVPAIWYFIIAKQINKKDFYNPTIYKLFRKIAIFLMFTAMIPLLLPRVVRFDSSYEIPEFWFNIHPTFILFLAALFESFAIILKDAKKQKEENELTI